MTLAHEIVPNLVAAQLVFRGARAASRDETAQQGEAGRNEFLPVMTAVCQRIEFKRALVRVLRLGIDAGRQDAAPQIAGRNEVVAREEHQDICREARDFGCRQ